MDYIFQLCKPKYNWANWKTTQKLDQLVVFLYTSFISKNKGVFIVKLSITPKT